MISGGTPSGHRVSCGDHMMMLWDHMIHDITGVIIEVQDIKQALLDTVRYR